MKRITLTVLGTILLLIIGGTVGWTQSTGRADTRISIGIGGGGSHFSFSYFDDDDWWWDSYSRDYYSVYYPCCRHWDYCVCGEYRPWYYYRDRGWYRPYWGFGWSYPRHRYYYRRYPWYHRQYYDWYDRHDGYDYRRRYRDDDDDRITRYRKPNKDLREPERLQGGPGRSGLGEAPGRSTFDRPGSSNEAGISKPGRVERPEVPDTWLQDFDREVKQPSRSDGYSGRTDSQFREQPDRGVIRRLGEKSTRDSIDESRRLTIPDTTDRVRDPIRRTVPDTSERLREPIRRPEPETPRRSIEQPRREQPEREIPRSIIKQPEKRIEKPSRVIQPPQRESQKQDSRSNWSTRQIPSRDTRGNNTQGSSPPARMSLPDRSSGSSGSSSRDAAPSAPSRGTRGRSR